MSGDTGNTGTQDVTYNLVSILYHALQGAETYDQYIQDAEQSGDQDLAGFFRDVKRENEQRAQRAKQILHRRLHSEQSGGGQGGGR
jgi:rubrerythrin